MSIEEAIEAAKQNGRYLVAVLSQESDAVRVVEQHTEGVKMSVGLGALLKAVMPDLNRQQRRTFLEELLKEWRS